MTQNLNILHCNVQGLRTTFIDILEIVYDINPDIISLQETMHKDTNNNLNTEIKNYKKIKYNRKTKKEGGLQTYIHNKLDIQSITKTTSEKENESITITMKTNNNTLITHVNHYNNKSINIDTDQLKQSFTNKNTILTGDLNCKHHMWGSKIVNEGGKKT